MSVALWTHLSTSTKGLQWFCLNSLLLNNPLFTSMLQIYKYIHNLFKLDQHYQASVHFSLTSDVDKSRQHWNKFLGMLRIQTRCRWVRSKNATSLSKLIISKHVYWTNSFRCFLKRIHLQLKTEKCKIKAVVAAERLVCQPTGLKKKKNLLVTRLH